MRREYISASSIEKFAQCKAAWLTHYDETTRVSTGNFYSEIGNLIHSALENWDKSEDHSFATLETCFHAACVEWKFAETHEQFVRAKELLALAYKMSTTHPSIPIQMCKTWDTEVQLLDGEGGDWEEEGWVYPARGSIDKIATLQPIKSDDPKEIIIIAFDHKTGQPQTHSELTKEHIQAPLYHLWLKRVLVPLFEEAGFKVVRVLMIWNYISDGTAVTMYDTDFDDNTTREYVASISEQMRILEDEYNETVEKEENLSEFLSKHEKINPYCSYCPRKGSCQTFNRLLSFESVIDINSPNVSWDEIWADYEKLQVVYKATEKKLDEIKSLVPVYLDQEKLPVITLSDGREITADRQTRKEYVVSEVERILGDAFVRQYAKITKTEIDKYIAALSKTDADKARAIAVELESAYRTAPGPRPVRARKQQGK